MARPTKWRKIECTPAIPYYIPSKENSKEVETQILLLEELEAIRLKDYEGLEQAECAERMEVSRPTFQRILLLAREKIADALLHGKAIHIDGGNYTMQICNICCSGCGSQWKESIENLKQETTHVCPKCGSTHVSCMKSCKNGNCMKKCKRNQSEN